MRRKRKNVTLPEGIVKKIDLLMERLDYWSSRSDFVREACLEKIEKHRAELTSALHKKRTHINPKETKANMTSDEECSEEKEADFEGHVIDAFKPVHKALGEALAKLAEHDISAIVRFNAKLGTLMVVLEVPKEAVIWEGEKGGGDALRKIIKSRSVT